MNTHVASGVGEYDLWGMYFINIVEAFPVGRCRDRRLMNRGVALAAERTRRGARWHAQALTEHIIEIGLEPFDTLFQLSSLITWFRMLIGGYIERRDPVGTQCSYLVYRAVVGLGACLLMDPLELLMQGLKSIPC